MSRPPYRSLAGAAALIDQQISRKPKREVPESPEPPDWHQDIPPASEPEPSKAPPQARHDIVLTRASDLKITPIRWLWNGWLACGKLHLLAGAPGQGKTTIALSLAATVTCGGRWPDGSRCAKASVLVWSGEDDPADTLAPRLKAMGADMDRVFFVSGSRVEEDVVPFDPARDMAQLATAIENIGDVRLIVVDPIVSAVAGDSHKNTEVRRGMQPLVDMAAQAGAAVLGISHLSKGTAGRDPTERVTGSVAFTAVVRVVLLAAKVKGEDGEDRRMLVRSKSNIGPDDGGFSYAIEQAQATAEVQASVVMWGQAMQGSARELLAVAESDGNADQDERSALETAQDWLTDLLQDGPMSSKQVQADARDAGLAWGTVRRAADSLSVVRRKGGMDRGWYWGLPEGAQKSSKMLTQNDEHLRENLSTFGTAGATESEV